MTAKRSFAPVVDAGTRLLILGSLPGDASLARGQYYAHPRNQFWRLLAPIAGTDLQMLPYDQRLRTLRAAGIGLWDVVAEAVRIGSLDASIRDCQPNALLQFLAEIPTLEAVAFNGGTAARIGRRQLAAAGVPLIALPSSSAACTMPFERKRGLWMQLAAFL